MEYMHVFSSSLPPAPRPSPHTRPPDGSARTTGCGEGDVSSVAPWPHEGLTSSPRQRGLMRHLTFGVLFSPPAAVCGSTRLSCAARRPLPAHAHALSSL